MKILLDEIEAIRPLLPALHAALEQLQPKSFVKIPSQ